MNELCVALGWGFLIMATTWVYYDASHNGLTPQGCKKVHPALELGPAGWAFFVFALMIIGLPVYLNFRARLIKSCKPKPTIAPSGLWKCPMCAEEIQVGAKLCKHCGSRF